MGKQYRIVFDRDTCIGALACNAVAPEVWELADDGKVNLKNATKREDGKFEVVIDESQLGKNKEAAESCPVFAIVIEDMEEG